MNPTAPLSSTGYLRDLLDQPAALHDTCLALPAPEAVAGFAARLADSRLRQVVLTGMGSSFHAFHPLHQRLVQHGFAAQMVETAELVHYLPELLRPTALVIAASQSGRSAETLTLLERRQQGADFSLLGVSNTLGSPLAQQADFCLLTAAGQEETVSCKTYLAALMGLAWLGPLLCGQDLAETLSVLTQAEQAVAGYLANWRQHVDQLKARLDGVRDVFVTGRGPSLAAAGAGGLILKEASHIHAEGLSSASFRHGPLEMVSQQVFVLVFEGLPATAALNQRLVEDVRAAGGRAGWVGMGAAEDALRLPRVPAALLPVVEILPVQMMTVALAELRGHQPGQFTHASKVTSVE